MTSPVTIDTTDLPTSQQPTHDMLSSTSSITNQTDSTSASVISTISEILPHTTKAYFTESTSVSLDSTTGMDANVTEMSSSTGFDEKTTKLDEHSTQSTVETTTISESVETISTSETSDGIESTTRSVSAESTSLDWPNTTTQENGTQSISTTGYTTETRLESDEYHSTTSDHRFYTIETTLEPSPQFTSTTPADVETPRVSRSPDYTDELSSWPFSSQSSDEQSSSSSTVQATTQTNSETIVDLNTNLTSTGIIQ